MFKEEKVVTFDKEVFVRGGVVTIEHLERRKIDWEYAPPAEKWDTERTVNYLIETVNKDYIELMDVDDNYTTVYSHEVITCANFRKEHTSAVRIVGVVKSLANIMEVE